MKEKEREYHLSKKHHMKILWEEFFKSDDDTMAQDATLVDKASIVGRVGIMLLSCGTGAWRVRDSMDTIARTLGITCSADIGLVSIEYTCFDVDNESYSQTLSLPSTGVNMTKLNAMEKFVRQLEAGHGKWTIGQIHKRLREIESQKSAYSSLIAGLSSGLACAGFIFLLGGGWPEVICAFFGAGAGNFVRAGMGKKKMTLVSKIAVAVAVACAVYFLCFHLGLLLFHYDYHHAYGYIGAMLFVIPGFPFITSGLDMSKLDMRSGLERLTYAVLIIIIATMVGWGVATILNLHPGSMPKLNINSGMLTFLRLIASFCGVFGFSIMFNSRPDMAATAAIMGAMANTLRLSLFDYGHMAPALAAFIGALMAGLLASIVRKKVGFPRIAITVPSIVIMVPGLYMYRAVFNFGVTNINIGAYWITEALMIVIALPLGLLAARILTDKKWRHAD
ncbi:threonine/serine ThrE exporter family protein [Lactobacillus kefiranofaciens]|uniref:Threonine/serine exporter family protein n=1 Tax=Lactobacillus kefiranofaciens TaxID=267818 RepID=A0AAX3UF90_9LACO|nr:threonine/serine exporter family protein [Lactobacillus kefiranofaciens]AEG40434.1 Integral membrane protein [Lactobacillus kefiranofaciens subsp. kefiranofaciens]KRL24448.1 integral membrane protein [Lactobacillus kefiranofaciens subsp. kefirgranum DSM 10550 = JCM 8572]KRM22169.1 integral membrane protein [Lactobacillus kefiranofaciens subsp. kefiranofaciens DSM 5016 = JCM 6985]MCJ2172370.1 threonine/serine exporter family protein [Lactobacillus kefiranofaciens]MCP9329896.1 threonine/serin